MVRSVLKSDPGTAAMQKVAAAIESGAMSYLRQQIKVMLGFVVIMGIGLYLMYRHLYAGHEGVSGNLPLGVALAFIAGVAASYGAGYVGMWLAVKGNLRTAAAALESFPKAMKV